MLSKELMEVIKTGNVRKFYKSPIWRRKRRSILQRDNYECQSCKKEGGFSPATCVHHIKHLKDRPDLALDDNNLISLCDACHNKEHPEKFIEPPKNLLAEKFPERW